MPIVGSFAGASSRAYGLQASLIGDFESIATATVTSGTQQYIDFTNIPQNYKHLQIRGIARDNRAVSGMGGEVRLWFNSDTGSNYSSHITYGNGSGAFSGNYVTNPYIYCFDTVSANSTANCFSAGVIDILDYTDTNKYTTTRSMGGGDFNSAGVIGIYSGNWRNTTAVTTIRLNVTSGTYSFNTYSSFALYGIKG